jgi:hypothetical protein
MSMPGRDGGRQHLRVVLLVLVPCFAVAALLMDGVWGTFARAISVILVMVLLALRVTEPPVAK